MYFNYSNAVTYNKQSHPNKYPQSSSREKSPIFSLESNYKRESSKSPYHNRSNSRNASPFGYDRFNNTIQSTLTTEPIENSVLSTHTSFSNDYLFNRKLHYLEQESRSRESSAKRGLNSSYVSDSFRNNKLTTTFREEIHADKKPQPLKTELFKGKKINLDPKALNSDLDGSVTVSQKQLFQKRLNEHNKKKQEEEKLLQKPLRGSVFHKNVAPSAENLTEIQKKKKSFVDIQSILQQQQTNQSQEQPALDSPNIFAPQKQASEKQQPSKSNSTNFSETRGSELALDRGRESEKKSLSSAFQAGIHERQIEEVSKTSEESKKQVDKGGQQMNQIELSPSKQSSQTQPKSSDTLLPKPKQSISKPAVNNIADPINNKSITETQNETDFDFDESDIKVEGGAAGQKAAFTANNDDSIEMSFKQFLKLQSNSKINNLITNVKSPVNSSPSPLSYGKLGLGRRESAGGVSPVRRFGTEEEEKIPKEKITRASLNAGTKLQRREYQSPSKPKLTTSTSSDLSNLKKFLLQDTPKPKMAPSTENQLDFPQKQSQLNNSMTEYQLGRRTLVKNMGGQRRSVRADLHSSSHNTRRSSKIEGNLVISENATSLEKFQALIGVSGNQGGGGGGGIPVMPTTTTNNNNIGTASNNTNNMPNNNIINTQNTQNSTQSSSNIAPQINSANMAMIPHQPNRSKSSSPFKFQPVLKNLQLSSANSSFSKSSSKLKYIGLHYEKEDDKEDSTQQQNQHEMIMKREAVRRQRSEDPNDPFFIKRSLALDEKKKRLDKATGDYIAFVNDQSFVSETEEDLNGTLSSAYSRVYHGRWRKLGIEEFIMVVVLLKRCLKRRFLFNRNLFLAQDYDKEPPIKFVRCRNKHFVEKRDDFMSEDKLFQEKEEQQISEIEEMDYFVFNEYHTDEFNLIDVPANASEEKLGRITKASIIHKVRGNKMKYHDRWLVLRGFKLYWYRGPLEKKAKGLIPLPTEPIKEKPYDDKKKCMILQPSKGGRELIFIEDSLGLPWKILLSNQIAYKNYIDYIWSKDKVPDNKIIEYFLNSNYPYLKMNRFADHKNRLLNLVFESFQYHNKLKVLDLSYLKTGIDCLSKVVQNIQGMKKFNQLETLKMNNAGVNRMTMSHLIRFLLTENSFNVKIISLNNNDIGDDAIAELMENFIERYNKMNVEKNYRKRLPFVQLSMSNVNLGDKGFFSFLNTLDNIKKKITERSIEDIPELMTLDLSRNKISDNSLKAFAKMLTGLNMIQTLDLSHNKRLSSEGFRHLIRDLAKNCSVQELNYAGNEVDVVSCRSMLTNLEKNMVLKKLRMTWQPDEIGFFLRKEDIVMRYFNIIENEWLEKEMTEEDREQQEMDELEEELVIMQREEEEKEKDKKGSKKKKNKKK